MNNAQKKILFHTFRNSREKGRQQEKKKKEIRKDNPTWMTWIFLCLSYIV